MGLVVEKTKEQLADWSLAPDAELLAVGLQGDDRAFRELYNRYNRRLLLHAFKTHGMNDDGAETAIANVWYNVFKSAATFDLRKAPFKHWLYIVCGNCCKNYKRNQVSGANRVVTSLTSLDNRDRDTYNAAANPRSIDEDTCAKVELESSLDALPEGTSSEMLLLLVEGYSYEELSEKFNVPLGTVKSRINRTRAKLKENLKELI